MSFSDTERATITKRPSEGVSHSVIAKEMNRDQRTVKKVIENMNFIRKVRNDVGNGKISPRDMRKITMVVKKMYLHSIKAIFDSIGVGGFCRQTRIALNELGKVVKPKARPPTMQRNKVK